MAMWTGGCVRGPGVSKGLAKSTTCWGSCGDLGCLDCRGALLVWGSDSLLQD